MAPASDLGEHVDKRMLKVEVNLDDAPATLLGYVLERLFEIGVNDAFYTPVYMKKNRPGALLQVLCEAGLLDRVKEVVFRETTTLGVRYYPVTMHRLERRFFAVQTEWGSVSVKEGFFRGESVQLSPEYEDCRRLAREAKVPIKRVYEAAAKAIALGALAVPRPDA